MDYQIHNAPVKIPHPGSNGVGKAQSSTTTHRTLMRSAAMVLALCTTAMGAQAFGVPDWIAPLLSRKSGANTPGTSPVPAVGSASVGFASCPQFFPGGRPPRILKAPQEGLREICYDSFAILYSGKTKSAVYVVERLSRDQLADAKGEARAPRFFEEARLPAAERATLQDYAHSGYDRGHMAPAADMPNQQSMAQSNSLANTVPQDPENNRKIWVKIERDTRRYVERAEGYVYVYTGPFVASQPAKTIGRGVTVPTHLYKLVYDAHTGHAWAHWLENVSNTRVGRPLEYPALVSRVGIEFLPGVVLH